MPKFTRYANLTHDDRCEIVRAFKYQRTFCNDVGHAVSCTTTDFFHLTPRQWNGKTGSDAFAATLAVLVMTKTILITDAEKEK